MPAPDAAAGPGSGWHIHWTPLYLAYSAGVAIFGLILASLIFNRLESYFAENI